MDGRGNSCPSVWEVAGHMQIRLDVQMNVESPEENLLCSHCLGCVGDKVHQCGRWTVSENSLFPVCGRLCQRRILMLEKNPLCSHCLGGDS